jgi:Type I restriction modification DNA specificity domain
VRSEDGLPPGWQEVSLSDVAIVIQGQSPPGSSYNTEGKGLPFFQGKAEFTALSPAVSKWCTEPNKIAEAGDILISVRAPVGPTNLANVKCCIGRGLAAIRPVHGIPPKFILYYLRHTEAEIAGKGTGTTFSAITGDGLRRHPVAIPPLREQSRIVGAIESQLTRLDAAVAALERARANLKRYRASVLKAAVEGRQCQSSVEIAGVVGYFPFMQHSDDGYRLSTEEVYRRLEAYFERIPEASSLAFALGQQLLQEVNDRSAQIDAKGISILGWSGALLAYLLIHAPQIYRADSIMVEALGTVALLLAFLAAFSGSWSARTRKWRGVSDKTWFPDPLLVIDLEHLRQHYVAELHESRSTWDRGCQQKAFWLRLGQNCLSFAAFATGLMLLYAFLYLPATPATFFSVAALNDI